MADDVLAIRAATADDLAQIAAIHLSAYSKSHFTSRLSLEVLCDYYGRFLCGGPETIVLVEPAGDGKSAETILGFAVFGRNIPERITAFKRDRFGAILEASARNPVAAGSKAAQRLIGKLRATKPVPSADHLLLSIAVGKRGIGAGDRLLDAFLARARQSGAAVTGLYVNAGNMAAINRYVAKGFRFRDLQSDQYYMECKL